MKHIYFLIAILSAGVLAGCGSSSDRGEVVGVPAKSFRAEVPYGMIYVPSGSFLMGQTDQDVTFAQIAQTKQVTIPAFFMDQTEITNSQYRQFVNWVRDSIAIVNYLNDPLLLKAQQPLPLMQAENNILTGNTYAETPYLPLHAEARRITGKNWMRCIIRVMTGCLIAMRSMLG
jgi:formylglycine-generating enzyme required for sulfatase activity